MNDERLSKRARGLVDAALAEEPSLDEGARRRMRGALFSSVAAGAGVTAASTAKAAGAAATGASVAPGAVAGGAKVLTVGFLWKAAALVAVTVGVGAAVARTRAPEPSPALTSSPPVVQQPAPPPATPIPHEPPVAEPLASEAPVSTPAPRTTTTSVTARPPTPSAAPTTEAPIEPRANPSDEFAKEVATLDRARAALARGDATRALAELDATPSAPSFQEERDALRVVALCTAGRRDEGRRELARFRAAFPRSLQMERASRACD